MRTRLLLILAAAGLLLGIAGAWYLGRRQPPQPPAFQPAANPYSKGIYANGIVETIQGSGENINLYPEVAGTVTAVLVGEGGRVRKGTPLLTIESSAQQALVAQQKAAADAALAVLEELRKQPRPEVLAVAQAQVTAAEAAQKQTADQLDKLTRSYAIDPRSVSQDALDTAKDANGIASANLQVARRQLDLTSAGAWVYEIRNQERTYESLRRQYESSLAVLARYTLRAPVDGVVLAVRPAVGDYASPQGSYDTYTTAPGPVVVMSDGQQHLGVRVYVDEILVQRLPPPDKIVAQMQLRGSDQKLPLEFVRVQPFVSPKVELSDERLERVDLRVLPVVFRFTRPDGTAIYPGQLVDVFIGSK